MRIWMAALVLVGLCIGSAPAAAQTPAGCPVNDYQLVGQRWRAGNIANPVPMFVNTARPVAQPHDPTNDGIIINDTIRAALRDFAGFDPARLLNGATTPTLIVVVDDFSAPTPDQSHGAAVLGVLQTLIAELGVPSTRIGIAQIDTVAANYDLTAIATAIENTVRQNTAYQRFVINMSFIILPCEGVIDIGGTPVPFNFDQFIFDYAETGGQMPLLTIAAEGAPGMIPPPENPELPAQKRPSGAGQVDGGSLLPDALAQGDIPPAFNEGLAAFAGDYTRAVYNPRSAASTTDPLRLMFGRLRGLGTNIVPVASAGNFAQPDSFAPGSFPEVISVSASTGSNFTGLWLPSNGGEVLAPGAWFPFGDEFVAGTSFSAPAMSALTALALSSNAGRCNFSALMNAAPNNLYFAAEVVRACRL